MPLPYIQKRAIKLSLSNYCVKHIFLLATSKQTSDLNSSVDSRVIALLTGSQSCQYHKISTMHNGECIPHLTRRRDTHGSRWGVVQLLVSLYFSAVLALSVIYPSSSSSSSFTAEAFVPASQRPVNKQVASQEGIFSSRASISHSSTAINVVAKSGGKMIETVDEFASTVLAEDTPRPVLVFFSAAW